MNDATPSALFPIVGIGASAGGVEALRELFGALPVDTGMAYVLVTHLPANHESMLAEILSHSTRLPLSDLADRTPLEPDHIYVLPGGYDVELEDGVARVTQRTPEEARKHRPIDRFFHSLAEQHGHRSIGVVLSGGASDGTLGIKEIKALGGITFAQDDTAEQKSMPRSAVQSGAVDFVLAPADIASELGRIASHPAVAASAEVESEEIPDLEPVLDVLCDRTGVDFSQYKRNTVYRRIVRRIVLHKLGGLDEYLTLMRTVPTEVDALYHDILINVTSFFRNFEAFDVLKQEVFPALTQNRSRHDPVRVWALGCSTGEEAYSLAMALTEFAEALGRPLPLQVFATDLNAASIDKARAGLYPRSSVAEMSAERLRRFFVESDGGYRIAKPIRDVCIFARHNVLDDPPFSRMDLVSCRNMLIYLGPELQQQVIPILHYALRPNGFLWLGKSETIGAYRDLFDLRNQRYKIYAKKAGPGHVPVRTGPSAARMTPVLGNPAPEPQMETRPQDVQKEVERLLVARYAPPSVLVRGDLEILHYRGDTSPYLAPAPGRATLNLLKMLREGLALGVRSALQRAKTDEVPARQEGLVVVTDGREQRVNVEVVPIRRGVERPDLFMVVFEAAPERPAAAAPQSASDDEGVQQELAQLKQELAATREYLHSVIEEQEAANEELQTANEEVQSANEELQSINEELETSKEEVQSTNEELATVNDELHVRNTDLAQINNDLVNLLSSVQMAILMLGPTLRIRRFTPMAERLLNLIPTDVGRPVGDIKMNFDLPDLEHLVAEAMDTVSVREREVRDRHGHWYLLRVRPYRTLENKIDGAVLVLVDVDTLKRSQELLRRQTELLDQAREPIVMWALDGDITYWNKAAEETYGFTAKEAIGRSIHELLLSDPAYSAYRGALHDEERWTGELVHTRRDGQRIVVETHMVVVTDPEGRRLVIAANRPITERKESERMLRDFADTLVVADRHKDEFLAMLGHELRNPLAAARNVVGVLESGKANAEQEARALHMMGRQIGNMSRLIEDLLDVSRIGLSELELRRTRVDLGAVVQRVADQQEAAFEAKRQTLHLELPDEAQWVDGDAVRLEQIAGNLIRNASKYTPEGGDAWVSLNGAEDGGVEEVVLRVRDNGLGIAAEDLARVFELFVRASQAADQERTGLGIGLTLVQRLTQVHGGRVEAFSDGPGKGSEFVVRLPRAA